MLLLESILCQIGVWTFIYVQQNKVWLPRIVAVLNYLNKRQLYAIGLC